MSAPQRRATYMLLSDVHTLDDWGRNLSALFNGDVAFVVGSCLQHKDFRDIDVRMIMFDNDYEALAGQVNIERLSHAVSLWGRQVTGLPIDFQVQQMTAANLKYPNQPRNALGISEWDKDGGDAAPTAQEQNKPERTQQP